MSVDVDRPPRRRAASSKPTWTPNFRDPGRVSPRRRGGLVLSHRQPLDRLALRQVHRRSSSRDVAAAGTVRRAAAPAVLLADFARPPRRTAAGALSGRNDLPGLTLGPTPFPDPSADGYALGSPPLLRPSAGVSLVRHRGAPHCVAVERPAEQLAARRAVALKRRRRPKHLAAPAARCFRTALGSTSARF